MDTPKGSDLTEPARLAEGFVLPERAIQRPRNLGETQATPIITEAERQRLEALAEYLEAGRTGIRGQRLAELGKKLRELDPQAKVPSEDIPGQSKS